MCGICGFIGSTQEINDRSKVLEAMKNSIIHRGPDDDGSYIDDYAALGFRRLSIIDLDHGHQPMSNEDGKVVVTMNGEIYNHLETRKELIACGHAFANNSDTEVLVHAWEQWGEDMLTHLRGMFAFLIWDKRNNRVFAARDFFGIKPMYYALVEGAAVDGHTDVQAAETQSRKCLIYASEIKAILEHPGYVKELNTEALDQYLSFQYSALPETFFKGIFKIGPGECMSFYPESGIFETRRYFDPLPKPMDVKPASDGTKVPASYDQSFAQTVESIKEVMRESVNAHMIADVEVGSLLSSGIDSSYITALYPNERTYTVGFDTAEGERYNEIDFAKGTADELGKTNISHIISPEEYWDAIPRIMYHMDEPLADASAVALYFLDKLVAKDVKVVLSGEGADEFFGGYPIYHEPFSLAGYQRVPQFLRSAAAAIASAIPGNWKGKSFLQRGALSVEQRHIGNGYIFTDKERRRLLKDPSDAPTPAALCSSCYEHLKSYNQNFDDTTKMQYLDYNYWLPGDILLKADKMSMAHSLESRVPFLDLEVFNLATTLPLSYRVNDETTKVALRKAALEVLPQRVANKPKLGFPVPMRVWIKEDIWYERVKTTLTSSIAKKFFNTDMLVDLMDEHHAEKYDHHRKIWTVYVFCIWYSVFFEGASLDPVGSAKEAGNPPSDRTAVVEAVK